MRVLTGHRITSLQVFFVVKVFLLISSQSNTYGEITGAQGISKSSHSSGFMVYTDILAYYFLFML